MRMTRSTFRAIFGGVADGGAFEQGIQTAKSDQAVAGWTHVFTSNTINQLRGGIRPPSHHARWTGRLSVGHSG